MPYTHQAIPLTAAEREAVALRVARAICSRAAAAQWTDNAPRGGSRGAFVRAVHTVADEASAGTATDAAREDLVPLSEVGGLLERVLRTRVALGDAMSGATASSPASTPVSRACWLTLVLDDGCVVQHAFFGIAAEPQCFTTVMTTKVAAGARGGGTHGAPSPPHKDADHTTLHQWTETAATPCPVGTTPYHTAGNGERAAWDSRTAATPQQPPPPQSTPAGNGTLMAAAPLSPGQVGRLRRGGWPTTQPRLSSPSPRGQQDADWAQRDAGSPYREELWRIGEAAMTTTHARADSTSLVM